MAFCLKVFQPGRMKKPYRGGCHNTAASFLDIDGWVNRSMIVYFAKWDVQPFPENIIEQRIFEGDFRS